MRLDAGCPVPVSSEISDPAGMKWRLGCWSTIDFHTYETLHPVGMENGDWDAGGPTTMTCLYSGVFRTRTRKG
jgi:hypothetical protein